MRARPVIGGLLLLLTAALAATVPPSAYALDELDAARDRRAAIEERITTTLGDLEGMEEAVHVAEQELATLEDEDARLRAELAAVEQELSTRTRLAFMRGDPSPVQLLVTGRDPGEVAERAVLLRSLALRDRAAMERAETLRVGLEQNLTLREGRIAQLERMRTDLADRVAVLEADLEQARADERLLELQARRQREVSTGSMSGVYACPVGDPVFFADTWGAPRSGGRSHQGVDMMAPHGTPIHAITAGRITSMRGNALGGISLYMFGDDGNEYYYTHLQGYADTAAVGARVDAGDLIAYNGSTGNASASAPHLHLEVHPGGGAPVNPYPYAAAACGR